MSRFFLCAWLVAAGWGCSSTPAASDDETVVKEKTQTKVTTTEDGTTTHEAFTYTEKKKEKTFGDYVLPWRWFAKEEKTSEVTEFKQYEQTETLEVEKEKKTWGERLAFWKWGKSDGKTKRITEHDVLRNMSPELVTRSETRGETKIRRAKVLDVNGREIWDDLNQFFFFDRPSRLSLYPTP